MVRPSVKRSIAKYLLENFTTSIRQVCKTIRLETSTYYRRPSKDDSEVEEKLQDLAKRYPTRGVDWYYGKIRQEGLKWNRKRVLRVYRKLNLGLRRKHKKRINRPYKEGLSQPIMPNVCWSMDFMSDSLEDGRRIRILNIIDDYNREALAIKCGNSFPAERVIRVLEEIRYDQGLPEQIRVDNGPEFTCYKMQEYCKRNEVKLAFIQPGKPAQNGYIERFNRTYREDILDAYIFERISQMQILSDKWRNEYNHGHPHQSLGGKSPMKFKQSRHKEIDAYEKVKTKMNGSFQSPALTISSPSMMKGLRDVKMEI